MNALRSAAIENRSSWSTWLRLSYEAGQAWFVVSIVGAIIGLNAALIDITTEWVSDIKFGYCKNSWWLNQKFCCWEIEEPGRIDCRLNSYVCLHYLIFFLNY